MKNKELTKGLCISLASAIVACSPLSILASEEATAAETSSEQESPASEPVVPDTPAPEPVVPDTPTPEPVVPDTPTPQPTQPAEPETPTPTPEPSSGEEGEEENTDPEDPGHGEDPGEDPGENTDPEDPGEDPGENTDPENPEDPEDLTEEEKAAAEAVVSQIEALAKKKLTIKDKDAVAAVRSSYDALSDKAKALVTNFDKLTLIENQMEELVKEEELLAKVGDPVYYKDTASIHHAGKEFYLKNLKEIYHLSFSDDIEKVLDEIVKEYLEENEFRLLGRAIVQGIGTGYFYAVAHPDRIFRRCNEWTADMEAVSLEIIEAAMAADIPLEINLSSIEFTGAYRKEFWQLVPDKAKCIVGFDAHSIYEMESRFRRMDELPG